MASTRSTLAFIICIFFGTLFYYGQNYSLSQLDSINVEYWNKADIEGAAKFNIDMLNEYEDKRNIEGIIAAYIYIANTFSYLDKQKEGIDYLEKANNKIKDTKNPLLHAMLYTQYGKCYSLLGLYHQSNKNLNKAIFHVKKIQNQQLKEKNMLSANVWKWYNFTSMGLTDSAKIIQFRNLKLFPKNPSVYQKIANIYTWKNIHLDSAEYYLNKADQLSENGNLYNKGEILMNYGDLYMTKGDYKKALDYYFQALSLYQKMKHKIKQKDLNRRISDAYKAMGEIEKSAKYYDDYSVLEANENRKVSLLVEKFIAKKEAEEKNKRNRFYLLISTITTIVIIAFIVLIYFIRKAYLKKQKRKDEIIKEKSIETKQLKQKVNRAFDKVVQLAKTNSPFFLARFKEVYPEFYKKLTTKCPYLTEHDIKFCAYLRLNLTNKEILQYENISLRTIESKKYRLKKKLGLPAETNLTKWILEL